MTSLGCQPWWKARALTVWLSLRNMRSPGRTLWTIQVAQCHQECSEW